jgi:hypothetical protein
MDIIEQEKDSDIKAGLRKGNKVTIRVLHESMFLKPQHWFA